MVFDEILWVVLVASLEQEELPHRDRAQCQHGLPEVPQGGPACHRAPEVDPVQQVQLLRRGLLILALRAGRDAATPRVQVEPVEGPELGEVCVHGAGVRGVPN